MLRKYMNNNVKLQASYIVPADYTFMHNYLFTLESQIQINTIYFMIIIKL